MEACAPELKTVHALSFPLGCRGRLAALRFGRTARRDPGSALGALGFGLARPKLRPCAARLTCIIRLQIVARCHVHFVGVDSASGDYMLGFQSLSVQSELEARQNATV
jgi:hypothetical protein